MPTPANVQLVYGFGILVVKTTTYGSLDTIWTSCSLLPRQGNLDDQAAIDQFQVVVDSTHLFASAESFLVIAN